MPVAELRGAGDAWVDQDRPSFNANQTNTLYLNDSTSSDARRAYMAFTLPPAIRSGEATVVSATLRLTLAKSWSGDQTITAKRIIERWKQNKVDWNTRPDVSATNSASLLVSGGADEDEIELDVTAMLADVSAGDDFYGIRLELNADLNRQVYSSDANIAERRPVLEVEWGSQPYPPDRMNPSGERAVSISKPVLNWRFTDNRGDTTQSSSQVQISTSSSFASPEYDSGKTANTQSKWDLSATAYAGLADDDVRYWRVKVWDGTDLESDWSDTAVFTRKVKGDLELVNPPSDGEVSETTPPISWTLTGATQERADVRLARINPNTGKIILVENRWWDLDTDSITVPKDSIVSGRTYKVRVRVWDDENRASTEGDPDYVQVSQEFIYVRDGSPDPVANLVAVTNEVNDGGDMPPRVVLLWQRDEQPDYFSLRVDGEEVVQRIDPMDALTEEYPGMTYPGDSADDLSPFDPDVPIYRYEWWGARPHYEHTYEIEAVVNNGGKLKHSNGNPTENATLRINSIWLVDPDDSTYVRITDQDDISLEVRDGGETLVPLSSKPIRITQGFLYFTGTASGSLLTRGDRDRFLKLKDREKQLRLVFADMNLPIRMEEPEIPPLPLPGANTYRCAFPFFQDGEFRRYLELD